MRNTGIIYLLFNNEYLFVFIYLFTYERASAQEYTAYLKLKQNNSFYRLVNSSQ